MFQNDYQVSGRPGTNPEICPNCALNHTDICLHASCTHVHAMLLIRAR